MLPNWKSGWGIVLCVLVWWALVASCGRERPVVEPSSRGEPVAGSEVGSPGEPSGVREHHNSAESTRPEPGAADAGRDSGVPEQSEAPPPEIRTPDGGTPDGGTPDGGTPDGGTPDGGTPDTGASSCGNGTCEAQSGENSQTCLLDCPLCLRGNIGEYKLRRPGRYQICGAVVGNINIELSTQGPVRIEGKPGTNPTLQGIPRPGKERHVSHIIGHISTRSSLVIRGFTLRNHVQNAIDVSGQGPKLIEKMEIVSHSRQINGKKVFGAGCINAGANSQIKDSKLSTGDDAVKISEPNSQASNVVIQMDGNGSAIQFGWSNRANGAKHHAKDITIRGSIDVNASNPAPNTDNKSGRSVIGGVFQNATSDIRLTGLHIHGKKYARLIKLVANGVVLKDVLIQGRLHDGIANHTDSLGRTWYAIVLVAKNGGRIKNLVIDLGAQAANSKFHYIKGPVEVKFRK